MEEDKGHSIDEHEKKDSEHESEIQSLVEDKTQISIDNNPDKKFKPAEFKKTVKKNPWIMATIVLGIIALILLIFMLRGGITGNIITGIVIGEGDIGSKTVDFVNTNLLPPGQGQVTFNSISEKSGLYEVLVDFQGREVPIYVTKDGEFMTQALIPMVELNQTQEQTPQTVEEYSEEDLEKIKTFVTCLSEKDFKIYGANWCGWTKKLVVDTFGGFDIVEPIYVECTEEEEICSQEEVTGFPTIKLSGELYQGARTFEGISGATCCEAPDVGTVIGSSDEEATCN